jgi:hypothetical protein
MVLVGILFLIVAAIVGYAIYQRNSLVGRDRTGTVESFRLTWGQQGQQILTIDGRDYNVWLDIKEFWQVERGNIIRHRPYWDRTMGKKMLSTNIIAVEKKKKKDAAQTESRRPIPT